VKPIPEGFTAEHELVVREDMTVDFEQSDPALGKLHPVYATYWLTKHMELVSRKIILPFLEPGEAGIGFEVSVRHLASALPGMRVKLRATHQRTEKNRVYAYAEAFNELGDKIGEGSTTQVILPQEKLEQGFDTLRSRWRALRP
jgi:fluoroacetyl-CoA thioesterase